MTVNHSYRCIFFDLDGTLLDTAPDLIFALQNALSEGGFAQPSADAVKPYISKGAAGMVRFSVGDQADDEVQRQLVNRMIEIYRENIAVSTRIYDGMDEVLDTLERRGLSWGIVTNKRAALTNLLLQALELDSRPVSVISGDSTNHSKPHPEPLITACKESGFSPSHCLYVGDAERDITAGRRAGMSTLVATYGYLNDGDDPQNWGACGLIEQPIDLLSWLDDRN